MFDSAYIHKPIEEVRKLYYDIEDKHALYKKETLLHIAARWADAESIKYLLEAGVRPAPSESMEDTPLHALARANKRYPQYIIADGTIAKCTELQLDAKCSWMRKNIDGAGCLHYAAREGHYEIFEVFHERRHKLDMTDSDGNTAMHIACQYASSPISSMQHRKERYEAALKALQSKPNPAEHELRRFKDDEWQYQSGLREIESYFKCVKTMLDAGVDPDTKNSSGYTAHDLAIRSGDKRLAALLKGKLDINDPLSELKIKAGGMSIHQAMEAEDYEAVKAILELGADINALNSAELYEGMTALGMAVIRINTDGVRLMLELGADPSIKDNHGKSPAAYLFAFSAAYNSKDKEKANILRLLINAGAGIDELIDDQENTVIIKAAAGSSVKILEEAISLGANVNISNKDGKTALISACRANIAAENLLLALLENGADASAQDINGWTALMYTAAMHDKAMGKSLAALLFDMGSPAPKAVNNEGNTAMDIAVANNNEELAKYLIEKM